MAGAGKTTIGAILAALLRGRNDNVVFLDGDKLREILGAKDGENSFSPCARLRLGQTYSRLCAHLTGQGQHVVCSTMALFPEIWQWNRSNISDYFEIYVKVPFPVLAERNKKGLYRHTPSTQPPNNVVGVDIPFQEPDSPDYTVMNDGSKTPDFLARKIFEFWSSTR